MIPSDLASFVACHEARDIVGSLGDPIDQIPGKYGGPATQVQADSAKRPVISELLGRPALYFDAVDDSIVMDAATSLAKPCTVFVIFGSRSTASASRRMLSGEDGGAHNWLIGPYGLNYSAFTGAFTVGPVLSLPPLRTCCVVQPAAGNARLYIDNVLTDNNNNGTEPGVIAMGVNPGSYVEPADSDWIATITFADELSDADRDDVYDNYIVPELLAGGLGLLASQFVSEVVQVGSPEIQVSQFVIEVVRSRGRPFYRTQVI